MNARDMIPRNDKMERIYQDLDNALYAAEITCDKNCQRCKRGRFRKGSILPAVSRDDPRAASCIIPKLRKIMGDHIRQDDATAYPKEQEGLILPADPAKY
jgi:hypothetical protein